MTKAHRLFLGCHGNNHFSIIKYSAWINSVQIPVLAKQLNSLYGEIHKRFWNYLMILFFRQLESFKCIEYNRNLHFIYCSNWNSPLWNTIWFLQRVSVIRSCQVHWISSQIIQIVFEDLSSSCMDWQVVQVEISPGVLWLLGYLAQFWWHVH